MKSIVIEHPTASDRRATSNEIQSAMSLPSCSAYKIACSSDGYYQMQSDFYGWVRIPADDLEWLALANEILDLQIS